MWNRLNWEKLMTSDACRLVPLSSFTRVPYDGFHWPQ
jgi:hypothetical protein